MTKNKRLVYIALLAAQAVVLSLVERAIPSPFTFAPGAKLGLANVITCISLYTLSAKDTFMIICIRLVLSTLLGGTLSTFLYSAAGAILSFLGMWAVQKLGPKRVSIIGVSVTGGVMHNVGQLVVASWVAQSWTVMGYLPVLSFIGILTGIAIGIAANYLLQNVQTLRNFFELKEKRALSK
ncbi:flavinylation system FAD exporter subunit EetB [Listeria ilorinensis]|uniref:flavinylation system FAD exporter subunit EetB n=1 Tax=Listeria ilorinensis TaxID=2867439 RepID=UPI001EF54677|nr:flavinylation system FAD exporter subunit EetB [Listeria ilorinensis]